MRVNIERAQAIASELQKFNWEEFNGIGVLCPPAGICPVGNLPIVEKASVDKELAESLVPLPEQLPSPRTADTYSVHLAGCLKLVSELCASSPYSQQAGAEVSENITARWQQKCSQLQSALQGAEYPVFRDKTIAADYTFPKLLADFTASEEPVKQKYLERFTARTDDYIRLHDELIRNVRQAEETTIEMSGCSFSPQEAPSP